MHPTTQAVRALYERFPYPAGPATLRLGFDVRRALSFVAAHRPAGRPICVLDAGCGRGAGLIGMAVAQPDVHFTGIDLNRVALNEVRASIKARDLQHVRVAEVDLETLQGLPVPDGGYDLIVSSGVAHHLVDPRAGLERLASHLAPWGVLDLMVYARPGRVGIEHVASVVEQEVPPGPVAERLVRARALVAARRHEPAFAEAAATEDVEFVDRYLHPQFVSYELQDLRAMVEGAGLSLLRWADPSTVPAGDGSLDGWAAAEAAVTRTRPRTWDLLLTTAGASVRPAVAPHAVDATGWALNAEGTLERGVRTLWTGARGTPVSWNHPRRDPLPLAEGPAAIAADFLMGIGRPFRGHELIAHLARRGIAADDGRRLCRVLEHLDVLWRPHEVDLAEHGGVPS